MSKQETSACKVVRADKAVRGRQELFYNVGVSTESAGARGIHMQIVTIPPGARAKAHKHEAHETAIYALRGECHVWHGERLERHSVVKPGDVFYIPANVPHLPYNPSDREEIVCLDRTHRPERKGKRRPLAPIRRTAFLDGTAAYVAARN